VRGNLSVIEGGVHIPFDIQRVYYLYDVPGGSARAGHGHIELQQLFVAMSGSFDVIVDDGTGASASYEPLLLRSVCTGHDVARGGELLLRRRVRGTGLDAYDPTTISMTTPSSVAATRQLPP
jgi:hypothetical protein